MAVVDEIALFAEANTNGGPSDGPMLVYLVELDGEATDNGSVDPGEFPRCEPDLRSPLAAECRAG